MINYGFSELTGLFSYNTPTFVLFSDLKFSLKIICDMEIQKMIIHVCKLSKGIYYIVCSTCILSYHDEFIVGENVLYQRYSLFNTIFQ